MALQCIEVHLATLEDTHRVMPMELVTVHEQRPLAQGVVVIDDVSEVAGGFRAAPFVHIIGFVGVFGVDDDLVGTSLGPLHILVVFRHHHLHRHRCVSIFE